LSVNVSVERRRRSYCVQARLEWQLGSALEEQRDREELDA
jgi:hypothetical protein